MVKELCKSGEDIKEELTPKECHEMHMILGIAGESGELVDAIKKYVIYRKPIDIGHVIEEMGDLEFYLEGLRQSLWIDRDDVLNANIKKLKTRHGDFKYSDQAAINRADKKD